ncbi:unnamed protein product, partial [Meganyctiphanes norvegica]
MPPAPKDPVLYSDRQCHVAAHSTELPRIPVAATTPSSGSSEQHQDESETASISIETGSTTTAALEDKTEVKNSAECTNERSVELDLSDIGPSLNKKRRNSESSECLIDVQNKDKDGGTTEVNSNNNKSPAKKRDLGAYWVLGFCNNFTYWVMITAAYDLLAPYQHGYSDNTNHHVANRKHIGNLSKLHQCIFHNILLELTTNVNVHIGREGCHKHSTGAILVADTLPATLVTLAAPICLLLAVDLRVILVCGFCLSSYITLGIAPTSFVFLGVALASTSRGFSDMTFLGHASNYHKNCLSVWSSGTGVATFVGPLLYSALTTAGISTDTALLTFICVPFATAVSFWCVLTRIPKNIEQELENENTKENEFDENQLLTTNTQEKINKRSNESSIPDSKAILKIRAIKFILPSSSFYFIMYFTNQGLLELVYFPSSLLTHSQQYSWSNTARCFGTLLSRSAHKFLMLPNRWLYSIIAVGILVFIACEVKFHIFPNEYFIYTLLFLQGLLEGAAFRSTMFAIYSETEDADRVFCLSIFPVSLFLPAVMAGVSAIPIHRWLCDSIL